jgi:hypothetical protein
MLQLRASVNADRSPLFPRSLMALAVAAMAFAVAAGSYSLAAEPPSPQNDDHNKQLDVRSSVGDLHLGDDADARKTGLPLYPGARIKSDEENKNAVNLGILTEAFGLKLVVASYTSNDDPAKVVDFYRDKLKKYGKVLECHTHEHGGAADVHSDGDDSKGSKELKCEGDNSGPVTELKVGKEDNQHVVAVEPADSGKGSSFALVYVHTHGKSGDI